MKKIFLLLSIVSVFGLTGCNNDDDYIAPAGDGDTIAESWEVGPVNFLPGAEYSILVDLNLQYTSDVVLVYRQVGTGGTGNPIWQLVPHTLYPAQGEVDYVSNFDTEFAEIYVQANYDLALTPVYTQNQWFKIVIIPANDFSERVATVDYSDYEAVIKMYNIKEADTKTAKFVNK